LLNVRELDDATWAIELGATRQTATDDRMFSKAFVRSSMWRMPLSTGRIIVCGPTAAEKSFIAAPARRLLR